MKHILPVLTVTALAAAASAQTAPAPAAKQSLSYNRIVISHLTSNDADYDNGASVFGQAKIGAGFYVSGSVNDYNGSVADSSSAVLGYAYSLPSVVGIASDVNVELGYKSVGLGIRAFIGGGIELGVSYVHGAGSADDPAAGGLHSIGLSASYNLSFLAKGLSLNASYVSQSSSDTRPTSGVGSDTTSIGLGFNF